MSLLAAVLRVKIVLTLLLWCLPLLAFPASWFAWMGMPEPQPVLFLRLLGAAFFALVVGYVLGLRELNRGNDVRNVVWVGIVSNGSAFLILLSAGANGAWEEWGILAWLSMWGSVLGTASITLGLVVAGLSPPDD